MKNTDYNEELRSAAKSWKDGRVDEYVEKVAKICIENGFKPETVNESIAFGFGCEISYSYDAKVENKIKELKG